MSEIDRISELPECLITQILSYLPIKESMKTSVLATSWKNHWLHVPVLELNYYKDFYPQDGLFISFIDRFLIVQKLKVKSSNVEINGFTNWIIRTVIDRGIQHLDLKGCRYYRDGFGKIYPYKEFMPCNLYTCETLISLKLTRFALEDPGFAVRLPCLKLMDLRKIRWVRPMTLEKLLSGCPDLEELSLQRDLNPDIVDHYDHPVVMRVKSRSLKRFCVLFNSGYCCVSTQKYMLEIDAPELEYLSLKQDHFYRIVVKNLASLFTVDLDIKFAVGYRVAFEPDDLSKRNEIRDFLTAITSVRHMIISRQTVKVLDRYSKVGPIPLFNNLSRLQAVFPTSALQFFPVLLESCPNLKHLISKIVYSKKSEAFQVINVPRCFVSTLECVEIQGFFYWEEEELKIASYFLENSAVLKKFILRFAHVTYPQRNSVTGSDIYEELNKVTKGSRGCQILVDY